MEIMKPHQQLPLSIIIIGPKNVFLIFPPQMPNGQFSRSGIILKIMIGQEETTPA